MNIIITIEGVTERTSWTKASRASSKATGKSDGANRWTQAEKTELWRAVVERNVQVYYLTAGNKKKIIRIWKG